MTYTYLLVAYNFVVCMFIVGSCICRLGAANRRVRPLVRTFYNATMVAAMASAIGPLLPCRVDFGFLATWLALPTLDLRVWPDRSGCAFATVVLFGFMVDRYRRRPRILNLKE